jgi:hypothetical protein
LIRRLAALLTAAALPVVVAVLAALAPAAAHAAPLAPETLTLRLADLGPNYELVSGRCGERSRTEDRWWPSTLPSLAKRFPHRGCVVVFAKSWTMPRDPARAGYVVSAAFSFADAAGPTVALQRPRAVAAHILHVHRRDLAPLTVSAAVGDDVRALRLDDYSKSATVLLWRTGSVLVLTLASGPASGRATEDALRLAALQQARIAAPTPLLTSDLDDVEVPLDNPRLGVPVVWLGRTLPAAGGRPALSLENVDASQLAAEAELSYGYRGHFDAVDLELSRPGPIRRALRGPTLERWCLRRYETGIPGMHAMIYGGPKPVLGRSRCEHGPPAVFGAIAFFRGAAVGIDAGHCFPCAGRSAPFNSPAGMRAVLRALRVRETPRPAPAP